MENSKQEPPEKLKEGEGYEVVESSPLLEKRGMLRRAKEYSLSSAKYLKEFFNPLYNELASLVEKRLIRPVLWVADTGTEKLGGLAVDTVSQLATHLVDWKRRLEKVGSDKLAELLEAAQALASHIGKGVSEEAEVGKLALIALNAQLQEASEALADDVRRGVGWVSRFGKEKARVLQSELAYFSILVLDQIGRTPREMKSGVVEELESLGEFTRRHFKKIVIMALLGSAGAGGVFVTQKVRENARKPKVGVKSDAPDSASTGVAFEAPELDSIPLISDSAGVGGMEHIGRPSTIEKKVECITGAIDFDLEKVHPAVRGAQMKNVRAILWRTGKWTKGELDQMPDSTAYQSYKDGKVLQEVLGGNPELFDTDIQLVPDAPATGGYYILIVSGLHSEYEKAGSNNRHSK